MSGLNFEELKRLDPKDIANWPAPIQLATLLVLMILIVVLGYFGVVSSEQDLLDQGRAKEVELKQTYLDKKAKAINLEAYKQQLVEIQESFGALLKQLPSKAEMETLITEINQSGVGRGLQFDLFEPAKSEKKTTEFAERPIYLKLNGNFHDLAAFASDIAQLSRIVTLSDIHISPVANPQKDTVAGALSMTATAKTYRALDSEEAVEMRKSNADAKKNKS